MLSIHPASNSDLLQVVAQGHILNENNKQYARSSCFHYRELLVMSSMRKILEQ